MKFAAYLLIFVALFALTFAADFDCEIDGVKLKKDDTHRPEGQCLEMTCQESGGLSAKTCPYAPTPPECKHIAQDNSKTYPECCERFEC